MEKGIRMIDFGGITPSLIAVGGVNMAFTSYIAYNFGKRLSKLEKTVSGGDVAVISSSYYASDSNNKMTMINDINTRLNNLERTVEERLSKVEMFCSKIVEASQKLEREKMMDKNNVHPLQMMNNKLTTASSTTSSVINDGEKKIILSEVPSSTADGNFSPTDDGVSSSALMSDDFNDDDNDEDVNEVIKNIASSSNKSSNKSEDDEDELSPSFNSPEEQN